MGLTNLRAVYVYCQGMCTTTEPLELLCHSGCCGSLVWELGRTISCLPLLEAYVVPSGILKASSQGSSIQVSSSLGAPSTCIWSACVFNNTDLPSTSGGKQRL